MIIGRLHLMLGILKPLRRVKKSFTNLKVILASEN